MALEFGSGLFIGSNFQTGEVESQKYYFTIKNYLWMVTYKNKDPNTFTSSYTTLDLTNSDESMNQYRHLRDDGYYQVYRFQSRDRSTPFEKRQYIDLIYKDSQDPPKSNKRSCLIDVDVQIYPDGYRDIIVHNNSSRYHHSNQYFINIINNILNDWNV